MAKKALIESTAKEIKNERVNKPNESVDKPNETTTQPKYHYSNKPYTPRKKPGLPSFEHKQWDFDALKKIWDKTGADDDDDDFDYDDNSNSQKDIDIDNLSDDELNLLEDEIRKIPPDDFDKKLKNYFAKIGGGK